MPKKYAVELRVEERQALEAIISRGKNGARQIRRAHTLLMSADGKSDEAISNLLRVSQWTVYSTRKRWTEERLRRGLSDQPRTGRPVKLDGKQEAYLVALACTDAPEGRERWTLQLLADKLVQLRVVDEAVSYETVRNRLKKTTSNRGSRNNGVSRQLALISCGVWRLCSIYMLNLLSQSSR